MFCVVLWGLKILYWKYTLFRMGGCPTTLAQAVVETPDLVKQVVCAWQPEYTGVKASHTLHHLSCDVPAGQ